MPNNKQSLGIKIIWIVFFVVAMVIVIGAGAWYNRRAEVSTPAGGEQQSNHEQNTNTKPMDNGLKVEDVKVGDGAEAKAGMRVTVNYEGKLINGAKFDSSYDRGTPFSFNLGAGEVIKGWDLGVAGMKVGGKRRLIIPSDLGYGPRGAGSAIPPNATLDFTVELLKVN